MGYPGENQRKSEGAVSVTDGHHAFLKHFRAELVDSLKHEKATGGLN